MEISLDIRVLDTVVDDPCKDYVMVRWSLKHFSFIVILSGFID